MFYLDFTYCRFYLELLYVLNIRTLAIRRFHVTLKEAPFEQWHFPSKRNMLKSMLWPILRNKITWRWQVSIDASGNCGYCLASPSVWAFNRFLLSFINSSLDSPFHSECVYTHNSKMLWEDWLNIAHLKTFLSALLVWLGWESIELALLCLRMLILFWES